MVNYFCRVLGLSLFGFVAVLSSGFSAHAADICRDTAVIGHAAEAIFEARLDPAAHELHYGLTTASGKDRWVVDVSIGEECNATVVVYTRAGTCDVVGTPVEVGHRRCG